MNYIEKFKSWVDEIEKSLISNTSKSSDNATTKRLKPPYTDIVMILWGCPATKTLSRENILALERHLLLEYFVDGDKRAKDYLFISNVIRQSFVQNLFYAAEKPRWADFSECFDSFWPKAIQKALEYKLALPADKQTVDFRSHPYFDRILKVEKGAYYLRQKKFTLSIENGRVGTENEWRRVAENIDSGIQHIGGLNLAQTIFYEIDRIPKSTTKNLIKNSAPIPCSKYLGLPLPVAYLLNLCAKHIVKPTSCSGNQSPDVDDLLEVSAAFGAIYDVYPHGLTDPFQSDPTRLSDFLIEKAIFQKMFLLDEFPLLEVPDLLMGLFSCLTDGEISEVGWSPEQAATFVEDLLTIIPQDERCIFIDMELLREKSRIKDKAVFDKIVSFMAHEAGSISTSIVLPTDCKHNFWKKPLIGLGTGRFCFFNHSCSSLNFFEAEVAEIRKVVPRIDDRLGKPLEVYVLSKLRSKGLKSFSTEGDGGKEFPQCDSIVKTPTSLFVIEVKKKGLTKAAESGDDLNITADLCESLIHSQNQLLERSIRLFEGATFQASDNLTILDDGLCGKNIYLITLTLRSFGAFQDKRNLPYLMRGLVGSTFSSLPGSATEQEDIKLSKATDYSRKLLNKEKQVKVKVQQIGMPDLIHNRWFLDLGQLLILLESLDTPEGFERAFQEWPLSS